MKTGLVVDDRPSFKKSQVRKLKPKEAVVLLYELPYVEVKPGQYELRWDMVHELKTSPLLCGFRGRPKGDVEALVSAIVAFSQMAAQLGDRLVEAEINPVFVLPEGKGVRAVDGVVVLGH